MPAIMGDPRIKEKFQDEEYIHQVEQMFREKFLENLGVSKKSCHCDLLGWLRQKKYSKTDIYIGMYLKSL